MSINLSSNFLLSASLPLDQRTTAATISARNAIPAIQRFQGLVCYVSTGSSGAPENWQLQGGIADSNWVLVGGAGGVPVTRYISPTGSNSNDGLTALTPWQTPAYAITQITALAPSSATINCAAGTYTSVSFDAPQLKFNCPITFVGNEVNPSSVTFQNTSISIVGISNQDAILNFYGISFNGGGANTAIFQEGGELHLRNCIGSNFYRFLSSTKTGTRTYIEGGLVDFVSVDTDSGFSVRDGAAIYINNNVTITQNPTSTNPGYLYELWNAIFVPVGNNAHKLECVPITGSGWLFSAGGTFIYTGSFCTYVVEDGSGLGDFSNCLIASGSNCSYQLTATSAWMEIKYNSIFYDNSTCSWGVSTVPLNKIVLANGGQLISPNYVMIGGIIIGDDLVDYITYPVDADYTRYSLDNRYLENISFNALGKIPQGITTSEVGPLGITNISQTLYTAKGKAQLTSLSIKTRIATGVLLADTYTLYVNGLASSLSVSIVNSNSGSATGSVTLAAGDVVTLRVSTSSLSLAEDLTAQFTVRILG